MRSLTTLFTAAALSLGSASVLSAGSSVDPARLCEHLRQVAAGNGIHLSDADRDQCLQDYRELREELEQGPRWNTLADCLLQADSEPEAQLCFDSLRVSERKPNAPAAEESGEAEEEEALAIGVAGSGDGAGSGGLTGSLMGGELFFTEDVCDALEALAEAAGKEWTDSERADCTQRAEGLRRHGTASAWERYARCVLSADSEAAAATCSGSGSTSKPAATEPSGGGVPGRQP